MPRDARILSISGIYHVIMRGVNKVEIFSEEEDYIKFLDIIKECKELSDFKLYAYCLMDNHFHLMLKVGKESIDLVMKRITCRYVPYYNKKYDRVGTLFQDRFKSECVEDEEYYVNVLRYIHLNPVKAKICNNPEKYKYSSYRACNRKDSLINNEMTKTLLPYDYYDKFHEMKIPYDCLDYDDGILTDKEAREIILEVCKVENPLEVNRFCKEDKKKYCRILLERGLRCNQIARLTSMIWKTVKKYSEKKS